MEYTFFVYIYIYQTLSLPVYDLGSVSAVKLVYKDHPSMLGTENMSLYPVYTGGVCMQIQ